MSLRQEFASLASQPTANVRALCRAYGISPKTGYKWLARYRQDGVAGLADRSRRPHHHPQRTSSASEHAVLALRDRHPAWGGRKLHRRLHDQGQAAVPSASTITAILRRHDRLDPATSAQHRPWHRFEHPTPNALWQVDFKGYQALHTDHGRCHPLRILDDHSRFLVGLIACAHEREQPVQAALTRVFRRYGLPWHVLLDNGPPRGAAGMAGLTALEVWLMRLDIAIWHGRPHHPQTQGKVERFHRTVTAELGRDWRYPDLAACQQAFDAWRTVYNCERPHEALALATPASRYQPSRRPFPEVPPPLEYALGDQVRLVQPDGTIS